MRYAVLDWDNTIRRGFTLFNWIDYLCNEGIIDRKINKKIEFLQNLYISNKIDHDDYAMRAGMIYADAVKGISIVMRDQLVAQYIDNDEKQFHPFVKGLFSYLRKYEIKPVIVSGAPQYILDCYSEKFSLHRIYAFCEKYENGFCSGSADYNYGANKKNTIQMLCADYGCKPLIGFGDSDSDIPLFQMSDHAFCVVKHGENQSGQYGRFVHYVSDHTNNIQMEILLGKVVNFQGKKHGRYHGRKRLYGESAMHAYRTRKDNHI